MARARALLDQDRVEPVFVSLAISQLLYPWWPPTGLEGHLYVLDERPYEEVDQRRLVRELYDFLDRHSPDVVAITGFSEPAMRSGAGWARARAKPVILMFETSEWDRRRWPWKEAFKRFWIGRHVSAGFVGGKSHRSYLSKLGVPQDRIWDGYDVVDNQFFQIERQGQTEVGDLPEGPHFLYVGRISPEKNLEALLQAYERYRRNHERPWNLVMVGTGPELEHLRKMSMDLDQRVVWLGGRGYEELPRIYRTASCFILPSFREPWGLVVNEAMASGLPVLVSNKCGCRADLVDDGVNGFGFEPASTAQLAELMFVTASMEQSERKSMGEASRRIISSYTPQLWAKNLSDAMLDATSR